MKKLIGIIENEINGNLSDFGRAVKKLTKKEILEIIDIMVTDYGYTLNNALKTLLRALNK